MTNYSRTTLRELKKRYLNVLKKCLLANLLAFSMVTLSTPTIANEDRLTNSGEKTYTQGVTFKDLEHLVSVGGSFGGAINNTSTITFGGLATFEGNSAIATGGHSYGGAIRNNGVNAMLTFKDEAQFKNNTATANAMEKADGTLAGGNSQGGAIYNSGTITFGRLVTFEGNKSSATGGHSYGGAIRNEDANAVLTFNDGAQFKNNTATETAMKKADGSSAGGNANGGVISNAGSITFGGLATFEGNSATATGGNSYGGAISNSGGSVVFEDTDNNAETPAVPNITYGITFNGDTLFTGNKAESETGHSYGGAISNSGYMLLAGENTFGGYLQDTEDADGDGDKTEYVLDSEGNKISLGNEAKYGGAIYNIVGKKEGDVIAYGMTLGKSTFMGNTALSYGGAIYNSGYMNFTDEALFEGNTALSHGGAIWNSGYMNFTDEAVFEGNKASSQGGAIRNGGVNAVLIFNDESLFKNNKATAVGSNSYGGAIYNFGGSVVFEDTDSNVETPAVPNIAYGITFKGDTLFTSNKAESETGKAEGGAIGNNGYMLLAGENTFGGYEVDENGDYVLDLEGNKISLGNEAKKGGAIYNSGGKKEGDVIAYGMTLGKSTFMGNTALSSGGAIYNTGYMNFTDEALFEGNEAKQGGAIYNNGTIEFNKKAEFIGNKSSSSGGAIYNDEKITFKDSVKFEGNETEIDGGAIGKGNILFEKDALFINNKSTNQYTGAGGAIWAAKTRFLAHAEFIGNFATWGGAVTGGEFNTARFEDNSANGGGAINSTGITIFNGKAEFINNTVSWQGGAIRLEGGTVTFKNGVEFSGNRAPTGNDVYFNGVGTINFGAVPEDLNQIPETITGAEIVEGGFASKDEKGIVNKYSNSTLTFLDSADNAGFKGTFNQYIGKTIAHSEKFLAGTNNILGGELETHGNTINYSANIGDETRTASLIHHSTATGNSDPTSLTTALKIGASSTALFDSATNGIQANYVLSEDMAGAGTVTFKDAHLTLGQTNYNGAYIMGENVTLDMQDGDTGDSVSFANLTGSANLKIDADIVNGANGLELVTDQIVTNQEATLKLNLTDVVLSKNALDNGLSDSYTATVMTGGTLTYGSEKGLVATDIYSYEVSGANNQITIDAVKFNEDSDVMKSVAEFDGDAAFNMTIGGDSYEMKLDVTMQANEKTIVGKDKETSTLTGKKITVNGATLNVENVSVSGENQLIDVASGTLNVTTAKVDNIKNAGTLMLDTAEVSELENSGTLTANGSEIGELVNEKDAEVMGGKVTKVTNKGTLTANGSEISEFVNSNKAEVTGGKVAKVTNKGTMTANGSEIGELMNEHEATIMGGELETVTNKEKGMLSLSAGLRAGTVTNEGELTLDGVTVADLTNSATLKTNGSILTKLVNEQEAELTVSTVEDLTNTGKMTAKDLTLKGALKGTGTATLSGKLVADDIFKSENKIISDGMEVSENIQKMELADLEVKEGTTLDIGTREVTAKDVKVGDKATLQVTLNDLDDHGTMKADKIEAGAGAGVHLVLGEKFEGGVFDVFKGTKGAGDLEVKHNNLYNVIEVEEGKYSFMTKDTEALQESLGATKEEVSVADAMTKGTSTNAAFNKMQSEMLIALQSLDTQTVEKAKKALSAVGSKEQPIEQSVASEHLVALQNVVQAELHGSTVGHSGGEEAPRAKVYIKGLYDRTKSSMGEGFRARSQGAVLGVQSEVTEDLTLGIGYATSQTTAKEDLRRTEVDTNTGFISAHYQPNAWWVSGLATFSRGEYEEEKQILSSMGKATYDVDSWGAQVMTGYDIKLENAIITPEVGMRYLSVKQEGYTDTLGTTVSGTQSDYLTALVGVKGTWNMGAIRPTAGVTVGYDIISDDVSALNTLANGASYTVNGEALDRLSTGVSLGVEADLSERTTLKLEYSGTFRKEYVDHSGMLKLEVRF